MTYRRLAAAAAAALLTLAAGCPAEKTTEDTGGTGGAPVVTPAIAVVDAHVTADGADSTTVNVTAGTAPLTLTTNVGTFTGGNKFVVLQTVPDSVTLSSCSARTTSTCAGTATIRAVGDDGGVAQAAVIFDAVETCSNGVDDNTDGKVDCQDSGCNGLSCGPGTATCVGGACSCPGDASETSCTNGIDDDCNGKTDCEEPSCNAQACSTAFPSYRCASSECVDPATLYGISVTPARPRIPAQAGANTTVEVVVTYAGAPLSAASVALTLPAPALGTLSATSVTTDPQGHATVTFTAGGSAAGVQPITATYTPAGGGAVTGAGTIALPAIGQIRVLDPGGIEFPVMGVKTSGYREQSALAVEVLDGDGAAYPAGLDVTFEHRRLGGSTLAGPLAATTACPAPSCVQSAGQTDANGLARAQLYSGTVAGVVRVSAKATAGATPRAFDLPTIAIVGAKANAGHLAVFCAAKDGTEISQALADTTCHVSKVEDQLTCVALLKDRYGNVLGTSSAVSFMSEAGTVGPPAFTPEYDPAVDAAGQTELGSAVDFINTLGGKLPKDVAPLAAAGEESFSPGVPDECGVTVHNPRDGVVTVVAWTAGEEAFTDVNGDGVYDAGEPFVDLPEPFVDYDDDDVRDGDEPFIDGNGDGSWSAPNGVWDSSASIWTKTVVLYSGRAAFARAGGSDYLSRWMEASDAGLYPGPTPIAAFAVRPAFPAETFTDTNVNGKWDTGEPFVDLDRDATYDAAKTPATMETLYVTASDVNLNRLPQSATYAITKPDGATFKVTFDGFSWDADAKGFSFGYQPCNGQTPTTCALDCAEVAASGSYASPGQCVMRTHLAGFSYGKVFAATITGGDEGVRDGATQAFWNITSFNETLRLAVSGTHQ